MRVLHIESGAFSKSSRSLFELAGVLMDPVIKYLPKVKILKEQQETNDGITTVDWDEVTFQLLLLFSYRLNSIRMSAKLLYRVPEVLLLTCTTTSYRPNQLPS